LGPGTKLLDCATYLAIWKAPSQPNPTKKIPSGVNNNNERVEGALKFANSCDSVRQLTPVGAGPAGFCRFFRWVRCHHTMPETTVLMDVGSGGRTVCMWPMLFGSPAIMLGLEKEAAIYNRSVQPVETARRTSGTKVDHCCL